MTATDLASVRDEEAADSGFGHWVAVRRGVLVLYFLALVLWSAHYGIPVQRELVIPGPAARSLAPRSAGRRGKSSSWCSTGCRSSRSCGRYDLTRGAADSLGIGVHVDADDRLRPLLFFGEVPTVWLQEHLYEPASCSGGTSPSPSIYTSYFIVPFVLAGVALGARPARLPALHPAAGDAGARRPRHLHRSSRRRRPGWPGKWG